EDLNNKSITFSGRIKPEGYVEFTQEFTFTFKLLLEIGDESLNGLNIVNLDYTDNTLESKKISEIITLKAGGVDIVDVTGHFNFIFYDSDGGDEITELDLSNGGSTFKVYMEATNISGEYNDVEGHVIFKYGSVTIGDNEEYLTIEDALNKAESGNIVKVKYNTSFVEKELAEEVYSSTAFEVKEGVTLLLPYDDGMSIKTNDTDASAGSASRIDRDNVYVELTMPNGIELNVNGVLIVNARRAAGTPQAGFVTGEAYAQIHMEESSKITVDDSGELNSIGFIYGRGTMEANAGATIYDSLLITDFRGGSITSNVYNEVFPFDQYSFHHIEVPITINNGSNYYTRALAYAGGSYADSDILIIGTGGGLIKLTSGSIVKSYETSTGKNTLNFYGKAQVNDVTMNVYVDITTKDKEMPFPGNFQLNVKAGSELILNSGIKLLPGSGLTIEEGAEFTIAENGRLMVYDADEYTQSRGYPMPYENIYRVEPNYGHSMTTPAQFIVNGDMEVAGKIAGRIHTENEGKIDITSPDSSSINIGHIE
ncbi:MAG TPA: hypothetical protein VFC79_06530, partial [Tissierellaceae bacterium]|nr:hypothetical protein [Tissierellaceae bacterium]